MSNSQFKEYTMPSNQNKEQDKIEILLDYIRTDKHNNRRNSNLFLLGNNTELLNNYISKSLNCKYRKSAVQILIIEPTENKCIYSTISEALQDTLEFELPIENDTADFQTTVMVYAALNHVDMLIINNMDMVFNKHTNITSKIALIIYP